MAAAALVEPALGTARGALRFRARQHSHRAVPAGLVRAQSVAPDADPAEVSVGERLFLETRFAQFFAAHASDVNQALGDGDPVLDQIRTTGPPLPGAFAGKTMNCRSCHFVDDAAGFPGGSVRSYADFARRSPLPLREDGRTLTPRNSPALVNASLPRPDGVLLHFDGEFGSLADLVKGTFAGRNFGWLPTESEAAVRQLARVIREDDGSDDLGQQFAGIPYRVLFAGTDASIPPELVLSLAFRLEVSRASDVQVFDTVARLVAAYSESLVFMQDEEGLFSGSPYDAFLAKNDLPRGPEPGESNADYSDRLAQAVDELGQPLYVQAPEGELRLHDQAFQFGRKELAGLKLFLTRSGDGKRPAPNCVACHAAPVFTDFNFHNTGITQEEYDGLHGTGAFEALSVPGLGERTQNPEAYLPASRQHPGGTGRFQAGASRDRPGETDLGLWNVYANPDRPQPQAAIARTLRVVGVAPEQVLPLTLGAFKTPGLRDLGQSAPYFHSGSKDTLEDAVRFYVTFSEKARLGRVRNADPEMRRVFLMEREVVDLAAFLRSLNEDYQ